MRVRLRPAPALSRLLVALLAAAAVVAAAQDDAFAQKKRKGGGGGGGGGGGTGVEGFGGLNNRPGGSVVPPEGGGGKARQQAKGGNAERGKGGARADGVEIKRIPYTPGLAEKRASERSTQEGVRLEIVGGVADLDRVLTVRGDGLARYRENGRPVKEGKLGAKHLRELYHLLGRNGFQAMENEYGAKDPAGDRVTMTLTISHGKRTKKVITYNDPADLHPEGFDRIVGTLDDLVDTRLSPVTDRRHGSGVAVSVRLDRLVYDASPEAESGDGSAPRRPLAVKDPDGFEAVLGEAAGAGVGEGGGKRARSGDRARAGVASGAVPGTGYGIRVTMEMLNQTRDDVALRFPTEQKYDLVIIDGSGAEVYRWSKGRPFKLAEEQFVLGAGRHLLYEETLALRDAAGTRLIPGAYRLRWEVLSRPGARGEIDFSIVDATRSAPAPTPTSPDEGG